MSSTQQRVVILGRNGQVGRALSKRLCGNTMSLSRDEADLSQPESLPNILDNCQPAIIFNAAAYTAVDKAEEEESLATTINGAAVETLAKYAFDHNIPFIHYSTDYVFPGDGTTPWEETDATGPLSAYGRSKLAGEERIKALAANYTNPKWLIFRTSWVFDEEGANFVNTMLRLAKEREVLSVVADQIGAPTYAGDIATLSIEAAQKAEKMVQFPSGIYHLCNSSETSWHEFAETIFTQATSLGAQLAIKEVHPIPASDYPTPAARPANSRMSLHKLHNTFDITPPHWQNALERSLKNRLAMEQHAAKSITS